MRFHSLRFKCLLAFLCFVSFTWIKSVPRDGVSPGSSKLPDVQILYERLLVAEELGGQVSRNVSSLLDQLRNMSKGSNGTHPTSTTTTTTIFTETKTVMQLTGHPGRQVFLQPNIYHYMPHLRQHPDSLIPNLILGQGRRGVSIVLGIPTVKRDKQNYLVSTLNSLLYSLNYFQRQDLLIIVFVAEVDSTFVSSIAETIRKNFPKDVQSGLLEVISPSPHYYPDFTALTETFGDSKDRVKWRTKQNLDFSFLMQYAQDRGTYYVQLEDDVVAKAGYFNDLKNFAAQEASKPWLYLEFSHLGFIGKMFRTRDLPTVAEFFLMFHRDKPIDWLLDHILWVKVCSPEKDASFCITQHTGLHSSLPGKLQHLKDKDFGKQTLYQAHNNPAAELSSSLKHYQQHSLHRAYRGEDFFWALTPIQGDYILLNFSQPIHISGYLFRSGNIETSGDKFHNTTVEVLPSNASTRDKQVIGSSTLHKGSDKAFIIIGK
ncbi:putative 3-mannosyl-glycoprotein 4-beta-N-acetylglucosaminyltransferase B-like [Scophthalmus maximus]|uniref:Putative 3-mannosyl-glycoprotein 4-beta-N-acetylglucosaminyltransferase B-like n=1 Tax=Scophthalmus maximus TaxID=52904 RepID=A0A2U9CAD3_SCOMX|nr:putative 3-mannosyl-glycoprotein 4-beta-N-acetylglucosaminyltransferase B-like [Scophthalmus maximus]